MQFVDKGFFIVNKAKLSQITGLKPNERLVYYALLEHMAYGNFLDEGVKIEAGQVFVTYAKLAKYCGLTYKQVRNIIDKFKEGQAMGNHMGNHGMVLTICDYSENQVASLNKRQGNDLKKGNLDEPCLYKEINNIKEYKKESSTPVAAAPSVDVPAKNQLTSPFVVEQASESERSPKSNTKGFDTAWQRYHRIPFSRRFLSTKKVARKLFDEHITEPELDDFVKGVENFCDHFEANIEETEHKAKHFYNLIKERVWADYLVKESPKTKPKLLRITAAGPNMPYDETIDEDRSGHGF